MSKVAKDDSAIKLFGKTISFLPERRQISQVLSSPIYSKDVSGGDFSCCSKQESQCSNPQEETTPTKPTGELSEATAFIQKILQKPDEILLCPRCNNTDTKFFNFNSYNPNPNQLRHLCNNCQCYWTSEGSLRTVRIGSGRGKSKNLMFQKNEDDPVRGIQLPCLGPNEFSLLGSKRPISPWPFPHHMDPSTPLSGSSAQRKDSLSDKISFEKSAIRVDDPMKVAKSPTRSTLGMKKEIINLIDGMGLSMAFKSKGKRSSNMDTAALVRRANPAALSRSSHFHESV